MKKLLIIPTFLLVLFTSCKKSKPDPVATDPFITLTSGTTWNYQTTDNATSVVTPYTLTATSIDTTINSKTYRIFNSVDASGTTEAYYNQTGNDYYEYTQLSAQLPKIDLKYLNDAAEVGTTWSQPISDTILGFPVTANIKNTILAIGGTETVNNKTYSNVIRAKTEVTDLTPAGLATIVSQNITACYAPKYGLIKRDFALHITRVNSIPTLPPVDVINKNTTNILMSSSIQ